MSFATAGFILASLTAQGTQDVVKILDRDVPLEFPLGGPDNAKTRSVEGAGWKWETAGDGTLGRRFHSDGGWGDLKDLYEQTKTKSKSLNPYWIKVLIHQHEAVIDTDTSGVVRQHWSSIDEDELGTVLKSLAVLKASIEGSTAGAYDVKLDVTVDTDVELSYRNPQSPSVETKYVPRVTLEDLGKPAAETSPETRRLLHEVGALINDEKFDTDDGIYRGPYAVVYDIHPRGIARDLIGFVDNTPVASLSYFKFSEISAKTSLPTALFETWKQMVANSAMSDHRLSTPVLDAGSPYPRLIGGPVWTALIERSRRTIPVDRSLTSITVANLPDLTKASPRFIPDETGPSKTVSPSKDQPDRSLVSLEASDFVLDKLGPKGSVQITGFGSGEQGAFLELSASPSTLEALLPSLSASTDPPALTDAPGTVVGDFTAVQKDGPDASKCWEVSFLTTVCRGHVVLASGSPLIKAAETGFVSFNVKLSEDEQVCLDFVGTDGTTVGWVNIGGDGSDSTIKHSLDYAVPADNQWHPITVSVPALTSGKAVDSVYIRGGVDRLSRGPAPFAVTEPVVTETGTPTPTAELAKAALDITKINGTPTAEQASLLVSAAGSSNRTLRMTALSVLSRVKCVEAIPVLTEQSHSGFVPVAAMAVVALGFQDTPESAAAIRDTVEKGPFDHNRRFAAIELTKHPDPGMGASLNFMAARSWHARLESVRALAAIKSTSSAIIMSTMLQLEPNPSVRLEIARTADISVELVTTRLTYAAVNDPSQWVRAMSYGRLIDSSSKSVQAEALKGVKDDAVGVRLYLLNEMQQRAKEDYRPALRSAVTDLSPVVRAAALRAMAAQPGPVDPNEVKNTWKDPDPDVQKALAELAAAKGFKVPPQ